LHGETPVTKAPRYKYTCNTCKEDFTAHRKVEVARCISCGSMSTELVASLTPLSLDSSERVPQLARPEVAEDPSPRKPPPVHPDIKKDESEKSTDITSMFVCVDCARKFVWNYTKRMKQDPYCGRCKSADVREISPRASAIAVVQGRIPTKLSKSDVKRIRFIRHHWRMRCELKEYVESFEGLMQRLGFESPRINKAKNVLNELLEEVDHQQQLRLNDYDTARVR
jgi:DNA-directed RNA polymerase subunit RPC12/RpoP